MGHSPDFFCANLSRAAGEDIISSASTYETYIFVECPYPWAAKILDSKHLPVNLRAVVEEIQDTQRSVRFLLMTADKYQDKDETKVIIFQRKPGFSDGYHKFEFTAEHIEKVASILRNIFISKTQTLPSMKSKVRDFFICTHGSRDRCCARYGYPFYRQALAMAADLDLENVRFWQVSHIGGHRFAPTMISFPDGRYYGALDETSLRTILLREGDLTCFNRVYRGWGILPPKLQVLERELILRHGWEWFAYEAMGRVLYEDTEQNLTRVELKCGKPKDTTLVYLADIVRDESKSIPVYGSCHSDHPKKFVKYAVADMYAVEPQSQKALSLSPRLKNIKYSKLHINR